MTVRPPAPTCLATAFRATQRLRYLTRWLHLPGDGWTAGRSTKAATRRDRRMASRKVWGVKLAMVLSSQGQRRKRGRAKMYDVTKYGNVATVPDIAGPSSRPIVCTMGPQPASCGSLAIGHQTAVRPMSSSRGLTDAIHERLVVAGPRGAIHRFPPSHGSRRRQKDSSFPAHPQSSNPMRRLRRGG